MKNYPKIKNIRKLFKKAEKDMQHPRTPALSFDQAPEWLKGTSVRFQRRVRRRALKMNDKTWIQRLPKSPKKKACKCEKNYQKKPEEELATQQQEPETQPLSETHPEHWGEAVLAVLQDLEDVFNWYTETESA